MTLTGLGLVDWRAVGNLQWMDIICTLDKVKESMSMNLIPITCLIHLLLTQLKRFIYEGIWISPAEQSATSLASCRAAKSFESMFIVAG